ncbi:unnamed protein product [Owenia fusiformis]|uniref:Uncharacterized protein n=1 Tax=Owenia fusiformis TaxID=6347 RepID=A0A8J1TUK3_OWEFU|nr:unnamed protein product [Owenia fusiformis]
MKTLPVLLIAVVVLNVNCAPTTVAPSEQSTTTLHSYQGQVDSASESHTSLLLPSENDDSEIKEKVKDLIETATEFATGSHQLVHRAATKGLTYDDTMSAIDDLKSLHEDITSIIVQLSDLTEDESQDENAEDEKETTYDETVLDKIFLEALKKIELSNEDILSLIVDQGLLGTDGARLRMSTKLLNTIAREGLIEAAQDLKLALEEEIEDSAEVEEIVTSILHYANAMETTLEAIKEAFDDAALLVSREAGLLSESSSSDEDQDSNDEDEIDGDDSDEDGSDNDDSDEDDSDEDEQERRVRRDTGNYNPTYTLPGQRRPFYNPNTPRFTLQNRRFGQYNLGRGWELNRDTLSWTSRSGNARFSVSPKWSLSNPGASASFSYRFGG